MHNRKLEATAATILRMCSAPSGEPKFDPRPDGAGARHPSTSFRGRPGHRPARGLIAPRFGGGRRGVLGCADARGCRMSPGRSETMRQALVEFMSGSSYRPATARDLMRLLRIDGTRRHEFKRTLRALLNDEEIVKVGRDRY